MGTGKKEGETSVRKQSRPLTPRRYFLSLSHPLPPARKKEIKPGKTGSKNADNAETSQNRKKSGIPRRLAILILIKIKRGRVVGGNRGKMMRKNG